MGSRIKSDPEFSPFLCLCLVAWQVVRKSLEGLFGFQIRVRGKYNVMKVPYRR